MPNCSFLRAVQHANCLYGRNLGVVSTCAAITKSPALARNVTPALQTTAPRSGTWRSTLPRHIGETLAQAADLLALPCPFAIPGFTVKQYWHARYHADADNRWLRGVCAQLLMK